MKEIYFGTDKRYSSGLSQTLGWSNLRKNQNHSSVFGQYFMSTTQWTLSNVQELQLVLLLMLASFTLGPCDITYYEIWDTLRHLHALWAKYLPELVTKLCHHQL
ncbi:hypothetical protein RJT34_15511 [Clitoria ternatea]|uniref:Uncharacterized protein n=1 Tax=Clitoria ternatea TaxID=43366 RepID=A0AAN9J5K6_CLITE